MLPGSKELIAALKQIHDLHEEAMAWAHKEEHLYFSEEMDKLGDWFDKGVTKHRDMKRPILDRIFALGGTWDDVEEDGLKALRAWLTKLEAINDACQAAYEASEDPDDYTTQALLMEAQTGLEKLIVKLQGRIAWAEKIGPELFNAEMK